MKLSAQERAELEAKARRAGVRISDGARAALAAWNPAEKVQPQAQDQRPTNIVKTGINTRG